MVSTMNYTAGDVLRVARRQNNKKRQYLLVNPLQGKHVPVSPTAALSMMAALGAKVREAFPAARFVIGFAETATAIGAAVAAKLSPDCVYLQTTREAAPGVTKWLDFLEEHSHAPEQRLAADGLAARLAATDTVVFVDDELSTGRTLCNILAQMKRELPVLREKKLVAASLLNRLTEADTARLEAQGAECICLVKLPEADYTAQAERFAVRGAVDCTQAAGKRTYQRLPKESFATPRQGVFIGEYVAFWEGVGRKMAVQLGEDAAGDVLVLGTEECMMPGLLVGRELERSGARSVHFHATTRSPIGIAAAEGYPVRSGWRIRSLYGDDRENYIYNLRRYDAVLVVSDTLCPEREALRSLLHALEENGCRRVFYLGGKEAADV